MRFKPLNGKIGAFLIALFIVGSLYSAMPEVRTATPIPGTGITMTGPTMTYATPSVTAATDLTVTILTGPTPSFDFTLILLPPSVTVEQGETANYQLQITYSDPSYYGIQINYQVIGLSPGLNWIPSGGGAIPISTSPTAPPGAYQIMVIASAQGKTHQTSATLIVTESTPSEDETTTTLIEPTSPTAIEPTTVTITEQVATQTPTPTTEPQTYKEGSDLTSQLLNPTVLMAIIIAVLATALITTLMQKRK